MKKSVPTIPLRTAPSDNTVRRIDPKAYRPELHALSFCSVKEQLTFIVTASRPLTPKERENFIETAARFHEKNPANKKKIVFGYNFIDNNQTLIIGVFGRYVSTEGTRKRGRSNLYQNEEYVAIEAADADEEFRKEIQELARTLVSRGGIWTNDIEIEDHDCHPKSQDIRLHRAQCLPARRAPR